MGPRHSPSDAVDQLPGPAVKRLTSDKARKPSKTRVVDRVEAGAVSEASSVTVRVASGPCVAA